MRWGIKAPRLYIRIRMLNIFFSFSLCFEKKYQFNNINMNNFRYQLERYRGRSSRYVCPQCGRKYVFTRYVDTHNNNQYVGDKVGKCNRLDKCGYHYTPR